MITIQCLKFVQDTCVLYLGGVLVEDLVKWQEADHIKADIWRRDVSEGYQRAPSKERFKKIADYILGHLGIQERILANTIILNLRRNEGVSFSPNDLEDRKKTLVPGVLRLEDEALPFYEVDGQHRIRGVIEAYKTAKESKDEKQLAAVKAYPVPLTIIHGLDRPSEAVQFVVINKTQKSVDPALVLRILHRRYSDKGEKLEYFLKGEAWKLQAVGIAELLNEDEDGPWLDRIKAPGDLAKDKIISEKNFVASLSAAFVNERVSYDDIKRFLPIYWRAIAALWDDCTGEEAKGYSLMKTNGTHVINSLFPYILFKCKSVESCDIAGFKRELRPIHKAYNEEFWLRGGKAMNYTSQGAQSHLMEEMIKETIPRDMYPIIPHAPNKVQGTKYEKLWVNKSKMLSLRMMHHFTRERVKRIDEGATGCYALYSFKKNLFYVGRSEKADLKTRLQNHCPTVNKPFDLFSYSLTKTPEDAQILECALYHLTPDHIRENRQHPALEENKPCPYCSYTGKQ